VNNYTPKENPIIIRCQGADRLPLDAMIKFQGDLKKLSVKNRDRLNGEVYEWGGQ